MKTIYLLFVALLFTSIQLSAQTWDWAKLQPNGNLTSSASPHSLGTDAQGFVYVLGNYNDSLFLNNTFITKGSGSYIAKYDSTGKMYWYKLISLNAIASEFTVNPTGIYITGTVNGSNNQYPVQYSIGNSTYIVDTTGNYLYIYVGLQFFVCKMDFNGNVVWNKTSSNSGVPGHLPSDMNITSDKNNNIIVAGGKYPVRSIDPPYSPSNTFSLGGTAITDNTGQPYNQQLFYIKISPAGTIQWTSFANDSSSINNSTNNSLACDNNNNIYVHVNVGNGCQFGNNTFITTHIQYPLSVLAKLTPAGTWSFVKELSTFNEVGHSYMGKPKLLTIDNNNNVYALVSLYLYGITPYLVGNPVTPGTTNPTMYVVKFNSNGNVLWTKNFGENAVPSSSVANTASAIAYNNGKLQLTGNLQSWWLSNSSYFKFGSLSVYNPPPSYSGGYDYFIAETDTALNFNWVQTFRTNSNATGLAITKFNNNIYTAGNTNGSIISLGNLNDTLGYPGNPYILNQFLGKIKDQYIRVGAVTPTLIIPGCTITIPFKSTGLTFSAANIFTAELSDANGNFGSPTTIGTTVSKGTGNITATIPANLTYSSGYRVRIHSSDTLKTGFNYYAYADTLYKLSLVCPAPSSGFTATNITATSATVNWAAVGCASGYKVQYRVKGTTGWTTALVITTNTPTINLTVLATNTIYQWRVATRCRNNSTNSFSAYTAAKQFTTAAAFASSVTVEDLQQSTSGFKLYPNPATSTLNVAAQTKLTGKATIRVTDMAGKVVYQQSFQGIGKSFNHNINISKLSPGAYIVELITGNEVQNGKFIKE